MPQLFPMNWNTLIIFFSLILLISSAMIYFNYKPNLLFKPQKILPLKKNWNW
uniref:ATP synthase F0 subunit 8 n=1 Tax=Ornithodoros tabajara TaxID=2928877 RepID=UPI002238F983|nr:ATP synthase F0 subunit 8 [Ornithodoros tabajara]UYB78642.1 ATP synthase F0 subunit 8 [Ornithodoros tabajara]UYB78655.1 ATP synthase F0 subunit 8 [Ornithodoros tabajara]